MAPPVVGPDTFVALTYVLFNERGEVVDQSEAGAPLEYVHGYAQIVRGLEAGVEGLAAGSQAELSVEPSDAFGEVDEDAILEVDRADFADDLELAAGDELVAAGPDDEPIPMRVLEVRPDTLLLDANHPLAGQRVRFEVKVQSVRPATEHEIAEAQRDLEQRIEEEQGCCGHDHSHDHDHAGEGEPEPLRLVQISRKDQARTK